MKQTHQLIKLKTDTVNDLKRLKTQMGVGGLDHLIVRMIQLTDAHRLELKEVAWGSHLTRWQG